MTKGIDMKKKIRNDLKKEIRRKFECGEDLIELAIEYKLNHGTLRNLSAKEGWEKGKLLNLVRVKESFEISEQAGLILVLPQALFLAFHILTVLFLVLLVHCHYGLNATLYLACIKYQ